MSHKYGTFAAWNRSIDDRSLPEPEPVGGGTATRAQLQAMRNLSIPYDSDHPPTFDDAARLIREAEEVENPMRVVMGPTLPEAFRLGMHVTPPPIHAPVRDIREAMHPTDSLTPEDAAAFTRQQERLDAFDRGQPDPHPPFAKWLDPEIVAAAERASSPLQTLLGGPHVATLPDGSRVNLPAGTVLREGPPMPEHPVIALVRSFVGKPGDKPGPVWTALMCVQARLGDDDMAGAILAANELEEALNERLGQMHDALGRDTAEGSR